MSLFPVHTVTGSRPYADFDNMTPTSLPGAIRRVIKRLACTYDKHQSNICKESKSHVKKRKNQRLPNEFHWENGAQDWNRTSDTAIFNRMLYQLSYLGAGDWPKRSCHRFQAGA